MRRDSACVSCSGGGRCFGALAVCVFCFAARRKFVRTPGFLRHLPLHGHLKKGTENQRMPARSGGGWFGASQRALRAPTTCGQTCTWSVGSSPRGACSGVEAQPEKQRFPRLELQSLVRVSNRLHAAWLAEQESAQPQGRVVRAGWAAFARSRITSH